MSQRIAPLFVGLAIGCLLLGFLQYQKHQAAQQTAGDTATAGESGVKEPGEAAPSAEPGATEPQSPTP